MDQFTKIEVGREISREQLGTGNYPGIKNGDINTGLSIQFDKCISFVDEEIIKNKKYFEYGDILISGLVSEDSIGRSCVYLGNEKCLLGERVIKLQHCQNPKYFCYFLNSNYFREEVKKHTNQSTIINIHKGTIKKLKIPLPPLEEQERIVNILDKFYDVCENPDRGIQLLIKHNRKQYEYYRDLIFDHMKIGD